MKETARLTSSPIEVFLSPGFLIALGILLVNDFYLKAVFHNDLTGKLSDFSGLFAVSLAVSAFAPRRVVPANVFLSIAFVIWKTPLVEGLIGTWNSMGTFVVGRTVDYTDCIALLILPFATLYFRSIPSPKRLSFSRHKQVASCSVILISVFAFTATTLKSDRHLTLSNGYAIRERQQEIESVLRKNPQVSNVRVTDEGDSPAKGSNIEEQVRVVFFDFLVAKQTCDSNPTAMQVMIRQYARVTNIESVSISFTCHAYESNENYNGLEQQYLQHARELFEQDILKDFHVMGSK